MIRKKPKKLLQVQSAYSKCAPLRSWHQNCLHQASYPCGRLPETSHRIGNWSKIWIRQLDLTTSREGQTSYTYTDILSIGLQRFPVLPCWTRFLGLCEFFFRNSSLHLLSRSSPAYRTAHGHMLLSKKTEPWTANRPVDSVPQPNLRTSMRAHLNLKSDRRQTPLEVSTTVKPFRPQICQIYCNTMPNPPFT